MSCQRGHAPETGSLARAAALLADVLSEVEATGHPATTEALWRAFQARASNLGDERAAAAMDEAATCLFAALIGEAVYQGTAETLPPSDCFWCMEVRSTGSQWAERPPVAEV